MCPKFALCSDSHFVLFSLDSDTGTKMLRQAAHSANTKITKVEILATTPCGGHLKEFRILCLFVGWFGRGFSETNMGLKNLVMFVSKLVLSWKKENQTILIRKKNQVQKTLLIDKITFTTNFLVHRFGFLLKKMSVFYN